MTLDTSDRYEFVWFTYGTGSKRHARDGSWYTLCGRPVDRYWSEQAQENGEWSGFAACKTCRRALAAIQRGDAS